MHERVFSGAACPPRAVDTGTRSVCILVEQSVLCCEYWRCGMACRSAAFGAWPTVRCDMRFWGRCALALTMPFGRCFLRGAAPLVQLCSDLTSSSVCTSAPAFCIILVADDEGISALHSSTILTNDQDASPPIRTYRRLAPHHSFEANVQVRGSFGRQLTRSRGDAWLLTSQYHRGDVYHAIDCLRAGCGAPGGGYRWPCYFSPYLH